jgi:hypothetical protein
MSRAINTITAATAVDGATNLNIDSGTLFVDTTNNKVGIGTTSPAFALNVKGAASEYRTALFETANTSGPSVQIKGSKTYELRSTGTAASEGGGLFFIYDKDNEVSRLTVDSSGNVGVGTTSPARKLSVVSATADTQLTIGSVAPSISLTNDPSSPNAASKTAIFALSTAASHYSLGDGDAMLAMLGNSRGDLYLNANYQGTGTKNIILQPSTGNVRIGTTSVLGGGGQALSVKQNADSWAMAAQVTTNGNYGLAAVNASNSVVGGMVINASGTSFPTQSDYRLKTNLEPIVNGIERVKQLPVYSFNWKIDESGNKVDGFIAHEARSVVPESVVGEKDAVDADGNPIYQGIDQSKIVPLLTAALKEAIAKIETLEAKVTALEAA